MKRFFSALIIFCMVLTYVPFTNFVKASNVSTEVKTKEIIKNKEVNVKVEGDRVELLDGRNEFAKTFVTSDGTVSTEITQVPQHYQDDQGKWKDIQNDLVRSGKGKFKNKANSFDVEFNETIDKKSVGITVNEDEYKVDLQLTQLENEVVETVQSTIGEVSENQIAYSEIFSGISAEYTVGENFVKEDIIIEEKPQNGLPEKFIYKLDLKGLTYKELDNKVYLYDSSSSNPIYMIEAPFMYDAYVPEGFQSSNEIKAIPEESKSYDIKLETKESNGQLYIELVPSQEWLNDEKRIYPIVIDPTVYRISGTSLTTDTILRSGFPTQVGGNDTEIGVGRSGDNIVRSLLLFDLSAIDKASKVLSVDLNLYLSSTNSTSPIDISVHKVSNSWKENEATWQKRTTSTNWTAAGADFNQTAYTTVKNIATVPSNIKDGLVKWSLPVVNVNGWVNNSAINLGLLIKSTTESSKIYKKFYSSESTVDIAYKPKLVITYKTSARLGLEDYWDYYEYPLTEGKGFANIGTQNNVVQYSDFTLANYGDFNFEFKRTYNSKTIEESALGKGVTFTGSEKLFINTGATQSNLEYQDADGTVHQFEVNGSTYVNPAGFQGKLTKIDATTFELSEDNIKTTFKIRETKLDTPVQVAYIIKQEDLYGHTISYTYNSDHQLTEIKTGLGDTLTFKYQNGYIIEAISKNKKIKYIYLAVHFIQRVEVYEVKDNTDILLSTTKLYYTNNQLTSIKDSVGSTTTFSYNDDDVRFGLETITLQNKDNQDDTTTTFALDNTNLKATVSKPGEVIEYVLNSNYVVTSVIQEGSRTNYTLDDNYLIKMETTIEDGVSKTTAYNYNSFKKVNEIKEDGVVVSSYTYSTDGKLENQTDKDGTVTAYDKYGNIISQTKDSKTTNYTYDNHGNLATITYSDDTSEKYVTTYDTINKEIKSAYTNLLGTTTTKVYDYSNNVVRATNGRNYTTEYTYSTKNELTSVTPQNKGTYKYEYDGNGNLKKAINSNNTTFLELAYNKDNYVEQEILGVQGTVRYVYKYGYNDAGDLETITKPSGDVITFEENEDTQTSVVYLNNQKKFETVESETETTYKNLDANQTTKYVIGEGDDLTIQFNGKNKIQYDDEEEKLQSVTYNTNKISYNYLDDNVKSLTLNTTKLADWEYNENKLETEVNFGNQKSRIVTKYDKTNSLIDTETFYTDSPTKPFLYNQYIYDADNQIKEIKDELGKTITAYTYDYTDQLLTEVLPDGTSIEYSYDNLGNRKSKKITKSGVTTSTNYKFNDANQISSDGKNTFTYDKNGNLLNDGRYQYTFNAFDQLTTVKTAAGVAVASYKYDEDGRRIYSNVNNTETYYRYDGSSNHVLFEEDANGVITKAYTYDKNGHPLTMTYKGATYYYLTNYRGDVLAVTDVNGEVVAKYTYDAWGNVLESEGKMASINPYRYAGYRYDEETKLYYLMARYYKPDTGVFLSIDPEVGDTTNPISMNGNNYANNNPVMNVDPDGHFAQFIIPVVGIVGRQIAKQTAKKAATKVTTPKKVTSPKSGCNCFTAGTKVLTDEGEKNIEDIEVGDKVLAKSEFDENGELAYKEVTALYTNYRNDLIKLYIGDLLIETTDNHPFWVEGRGWVFADELKPGDQLQKADGSNLTIDKVEFVLLDEPVMVYNFTVADYHTYYVTDLGIWVHNTNCIFSANFETKLKKHAQDIYETSRDLGIPVTKGDKVGMKNFVASIVVSGKRGNSKPFAWNTLKSVDAYVKGDAVVLVNRATNEIVTFLNKKGGRLSSFLKSQLDLIK